MPKPTAASDDRNPQIDPRTFSMVCAVARRYFPDPVLPRQLPYAPPNPINEPTPTIVELALRFKDFTWWSETMNILSHRIRQHEQLLNTKEK